MVWTAILSPPPMVTLPIFTDWEFLEGVFIEHQSFFCLLTQLGAALSASFGKVEVQACRDAHVHWIGETVVVLVVVVAIPISIALVNNISNED